MLYVYALSSGDVNMSFYTVRCVDPMEEEEICLIDSATTNTVLRETKYFQTLTKKFGNVMTIVGSNTHIVGTGSATIVLPMGTQLVIKDALLYQIGRASCRERV